MTEKADSPGLATLLVFAREALVELEGLKPD